MEVNPGFLTVVYSFFFKNKSADVEVEMDKKTLYEKFCETRKNLIKCMRIKFSY